MFGGRGGKYMVAPDKKKGKKKIGERKEKTALSVI